MAFTNKAAWKVLTSDYKGFDFFEIFPVICATHSGLIIEKNWYHSALSVGNYGIN